MQETKCQSLIFQSSPQLLRGLEEVDSSMPVQILPILRRPEFNTPKKSPSTRFERDVDIEEERKRTATIGHSSGSTGLPTSFEVGHARYTMFYPLGPGDRDLFTLPLYGLHRRIFCAFAHLSCKGTTVCRLEWFQQECIIEKRSTSRILIFH